MLFTSAQSTNDYYPFSTDPNMEIGRTSVGKTEGDGGLNINTTSKNAGQQAGSAYVAAYCIRNNFILRSNDHSHPGYGDYTTFPSGFDYDKTKKPGDMQFAGSIEAKFPNATFRIYSPATKEYYYSSFGPEPPPVNIH